MANNNHRISSPKSKRKPSSKLSKNKSSPSWAAEEKISTQKNSKKKKKTKKLRDKRKLEITFLVGAVGVVLLSWSSFYYYYRFGPLKSISETNLKHISLEEFSYEKKQQQQQKKQQNTPTIAVAKSKNQPISGLVERDNNSQAYNRNVDSDIAVEWELRAANHMCWKPKGGKTRVSLAKTKNLSVDQCARLAYENKECGIGFDIDSSNGFCGCGAAGTTNDKCTSHVSEHGTSNIYHYLILPKKSNSESTNKKIKANNDDDFHKKVEELGIDGKIRNQDDHSRKITGKLSCSKYGGPLDEFAQEMVYWYDIPADSRYKSPFLLRQEQEQKKEKSNDNKKYMVFEPDNGGWNNIRMSMETNVVLAAAMGRTLVLPPSKGLYLLGKNIGHDGVSTQQKHFSFADFFHMDELAKDNDAIPNIITMSEFLENEAMTGNLYDERSGLPSFPPGNRTHWDGKDEHGKLNKWLRTVTYTSHNWGPFNCMATFPASATDNEDAMKKLNNEVSILSKIKEKQQVYARVDGSTMERMKESLKDREKLCFYDETMQEQKVINFAELTSDHRLLSHFYTFLFFQDWKQDLWTKRFVRDHLRYIDEIQCAAARVVRAMRLIAKGNDPNGNLHGEYDAFHVRRGDFQYKQTRVSAEEILENSNDMLGGNTNAVKKRTLFIATDERNKEFFEPFLRKFGRTNFVHFLDDFIDPHLHGVNTNYYGMIDQLVASKSRIFFGAYYSTFTGYIMRMRGYRSVHERKQGHEDGVLPTTFYYIPKRFKFDMHDPNIPIKTTWIREHPSSWRNIDFDVHTSP